MVFGIKQEVLEQGIEDLYERVVSYISEYVSDKLQPLTSKDQELEGTIGNLEERLETANETVGNLTSVIQGYETRLQQLERSQRSAGIVTAALNHKGEITYEDVIGLATEVTDAAYEKVRDYFMLKLAKKGYSMEKPNFDVYERNTGIEIRLYSSVGHSRNHYGFDIANIKVAKKQYNNDFLQIYGLNNCNFGIYNNKDTVIGKKLSEDLPQLFKAYMLGYSIRALEEGYILREKAIEVQENHGLKNNPALLERMAEVVSSDVKFADKFLQHYQKSLKMEEEK